MGSGKSASQQFSTQVVTAEVLRAGQILFSLVLIALIANGSPGGAPRAGWVVLISLISWTSACASVWLSPRNPLHAWYDAIGPMLITLLLSVKGGQFPYGVGNCVLGVLGIQLLSLLRTGGHYSTSIAETEPAESAGIPAQFAENQRAPQIPSTEATRPTTAGQSQESRHLEEVSLHSLQIHDGGADVEGREPISESWTRKEFHGEVSIEAVVHARFEKGAKVATIHLPFIPPLPVAPIIETEPLESGCDVDIQVESAWRHGTRLQVSRPSAGGPAEVPIGVVIYTAADEEVELS